jgi:hypothetical protein
MEHAVSCFFSPEAIEWDPTVVTVVGRLEGIDSTARARRRARGSRDVQRTEVALLFLKYDLFSHVDSKQQDISFLDGDALAHLDMDDDLASDRF